MNVYTLRKDASVMGERDEKYGFTMWCNEVEETDFPIMFNSKSGNVLAGQKIVADAQAKKTSKKGKEYLRLSGVKLLENSVSASSGSHEEAVPTPAPQSIKAEPTTPAASGQWKLVMSKLNDMHKDIKSLMGEDSVVDPTQNELDNIDEIFNQRI